MMGTAKLNTTIRALNRVVALTGDTGSQRTLPTLQKEEKRIHYVKGAAAKLKQISHKLPFCIGKPKLTACFGQL